MQAATGRVVDDLLDAYRTGGGVSWERMGDDARTAQAALNRPLFLGPLVDEVLPSIPSLHALLRRGGRLADLGCGQGGRRSRWRGPTRRSSVVGVDIDPPSIEAARATRRPPGVDVTFELADAASAQDGRFDVVTFFECVHDMADPVAVLAAARAMVRDDGYVLVADERTRGVVHRARRAARAAVLRLVALGVPAGRSVDARPASPPAP